MSLSKADWDEFNRKSVEMLADIKYKHKTVDECLKSYELILSKEEVDRIVEMKKVKPKPWVGANVKIN